MKASAFRSIQPHQKVNHFPGTFEIGRKDKLWKNLNKAQIKYSKKVNISTLELSLVLNT